MGHLVNRGQSFDGEIAYHMMGFKVGGCVPVPWAVEPPWVVDIIGAKVIYKWPWITLSSSVISKGQKLTKLSVVCNLNNLNMIVVWNLNTLNTAYQLWILLKYNFISAMPLKKKLSDFDFWCWTMLSIQTFFTRVIVCWWYVLPFSAL